jgi:hypothetical protein
MEIMITEDMYLLAKKIVDSYEASEKTVLPVHPKLKRAEDYENLDTTKQYYYKRESIMGRSGFVTIDSRIITPRNKGWYGNFVDETSWRGFEFLNDANLFEIDKPF